MSQPAAKPQPRPVAATPQQNLLAARVAAQARQQQQGQPQQPTSLPSRPAASLTPIRPQPPQPSPAIPAISSSHVAAAAAILPPRDPSALSAPELLDRYQTANHKVRSAVCEAIYYGYRLSLSADWPELGFASEEAFLEATDTSPAAWRFRLMVGERLAHLSLTEMQSLKRSALESLARVHPDLWLEYAWLEEAKALPPREFEMLVKQRNHEHAPRPGLLSEPRTDIRVAIPISQQAVLQRRLDMLRRRERLGTTGEALVFALEATDRAGLLEDSLAAIQPQLAELARLWKPTEEWSAGLAESEAERQARLEGRPSLAGAAERTQQLTRGILRALRGLELPEPAAEMEEAADGEILPQEVPPTGACADGTEVR